MIEFKGRVVMITGGTGNLGQATAGAFAEMGAQLVLVDHNAEQQHVLYAGSAVGGPLLLSPMDVRDVEQAAHAVEEAVARFGRIDVLVNTVGGYEAGTPVQSTELKTWERMLGLNATSVFVMCRAVIPQMLAQHGGRIVNVAARAGSEGKANQSAYSVSKAAVIRLTETMAAELRQEGITVNCVLPGTIDTPENREARPNSDPAKWVTPESMAEVIRFLASDAARDVSGVALPVYGRG